MRVFPKDGWKAKKENFLYNLIKKESDVPVPSVIHIGKDFLIKNSYVRNKTFKYNLIKVSIERCIFMIEQHSIQNMHAP